MHGSEDEYTGMDMLRRDSSQTLPNGHFHPGIDEEELPEYQLPKQLPHAGNFQSKILASREGLDEGRSYKSLGENARQIAFSTKNMKDSFDNRFDIGVESNSLAKVGHG